jgi:hypothetical protein
MADSFEKRMRRRSKSFIKNVELGMRRAGNQGLSTASITTAVDTGFARGNWNPSIGIPDFTTHERVGGDSPGLNGANAAAAHAQVMSNASKINKWKVGMGPIYIANGTDYIVPLNNGHSPQGSHMAEQAAMAARNEFVRTKVLRNG